MTKKSLILRLLDTGDSNDLIALKADCPIPYVNKIEKGRDKARDSFRNRKAIKPIKPLNK